MNLSQFASKWIGKRTDYDGVYAYQCVDLILQYAADVYGLTSGIWGNAVDYWYNTSPTLLTKFYKVYNQNPLPGDIVVFKGTASNPYGHIGVAIDSSTMLEQNGAAGDGDGQGGDEIRYNKIPKTSIIGLLRPEGGPMAKFTKEQVNSGVKTATGNLPGTGYNYAQWVDKDITQASMDAWMQHLEQLKLQYPPGKATVLKSGQYQVI